MYTDPKQVLEYAVYIGIEASSEPYLLWIAEDGIQGELLCCSVLQCVAVCCSVLQSVTACCSVLQCVAVCCSVLQCVVQRVAVCCQCSLSIP